MTIKYDKAKEILVVSGTPDELSKFNDIYSIETRAFTVPVTLKPEITLAAKCEEIERWVMEEYRPLFKGKKSGSMGDKYGTLQKMALFMITHPEYSLEDIMTAAKQYINSFNNDHTYMMQADYFIFKEIRHQGKEMITSKLASILEDGPEELLSKDFFDTIN